MRKQKTKIAAKLTTPIFNTSSNPLDIQLEHMNLAFEAKAKVSNYFLFNSLEEMLFQYSYPRYHNDVQQLLAELELEDECVQLVTEFKCKIWIV